MLERASTSRIPTDQIATTRSMGIQIVTTKIVITKIVTTRIGTPQISTLRITTIQIVTGFWVVAVFRMTARICLSSWKKIRGVFWAVAFRPVDFLGILQQKIFLSLGRSTEPQTHFNLEKYYSGRCLMAYG